MMVIMTNDDKDATDDGDYDGSQADHGMVMLVSSAWLSLKLVARGFLPVLRFPPHLHRLMVQSIK